VSIDDDSTEKEADAEKPHKEVTVKVKDQMKDADVRKPKTKNG
jgi:hypothetical protein